MEMWAALEAVQMKEFIRALPEGLDAPVSEGGGNLSVRFDIVIVFPNPKKYILTNPRGVIIC